MCEGQRGGDYIDTGERDGEGVQLGGGAMTLSEAARQGILRVRLPIWANEGEYLRQDVIRDDDGVTRGPWVHLFSRYQEALEANTPQTLPTMYFDERSDFVAYTGPLNLVDNDGPVFKQNRTVWREKIHDRV